MSTVDAAIINHITSSTGGGGSEDKDVLKRIPGQTITVTEVDSHTALTITLPVDSYFYSGSVIRLYNKNTQKYDDLMLIRESKETSDIQTGTNNSNLFVASQTVYPTRAEVYGSTGDRIYFFIDNINSSDRFNCDQSKYPEAGAHEYEYMSHSTHRLLIMRQFCH